MIEESWKGDYFTRTLQKCHVNTDMILARYVKLEEYLSSSTHVRTLLRALTVAGFRMPWTEDASTFEAYLSHENAKTVSRQAADAAKMALNDMRKDMYRICKKYYKNKKRKRASFSCAGKPGKKCNNTPSPSCIMNCCSRCCSIEACPRHRGKNGGVCCIS